MAQTIQSLFKNVVLLSGTPDYVQKKLSEKNAQNVCNCSPKTAMDNKWICKPTVNLVTTTKDNWPAAVRAVYEREVGLWKKSGSPFRPVVLVNCSSIESIYHLRNEEWFKQRAGHDFHFISIHSDKHISPKDATAFDITSEFDGVKKTAAEAYQLVEQIDSMTDNLPVLVAQVAMLGEGINVKSFNAILTMSSSDKTAMQQIGRALRNNFIEKEVVEDVVEEVEVERQKAGWLNRLLKKTEKVLEKRTVQKTVKKRFSKVDDGHANVYIMKENMDDIIQLVCDLDTHDLTDDCFTWGQRIDCNDGSVEAVLDTSDSVPLQKKQWNDIDAADPDIIEIMNSARDRIVHKCIYADMLGADNDGNGIDDIDELEWFLQKPSLSMWKEVVVGRGKVAKEEQWRKLNERLLDFLYKSKWHMKLWLVDKEATMATAYGNKEVAKFMLDHFSKKQIEIIDKVAKSA